MEVKAVMFHLLTNFNIVPTAKTQNPIKLKKSTFNMMAENGFWVGLEPRNLNI
jgi:cytochrome P450 family 9